ncbi:hypothetical protein AHAS_Ahas01G0171600 [Arachis hypogaea]
MVRVLSLVEESASESAEENMMVVREETPSEALAIVLIQVCLPLSQTTTMPEIEQIPETENEPTPVLQIEGTTKSTPEPPNNLKKAPMLPLAPSKINPVPEDAVALMMMAWTASYIPKTDPMPSFSLSLTDSSQEEAATQEGMSMQDREKAKTLETPKIARTIRGSGTKNCKWWGDNKRKKFKFETPERTNKVTSDMKEKCYLWAIRVKTYADGLTNEFDTIYTLQAQDRYTLSKLHLASLASETHIEAEIVSAMCFILNQQKIKRFQEEVYCLPPDIVNMALGNHPKGIFAPVCHSQHWWLWLADTRKQKFYIVDPYHTKSSSDERTALIHSLCNFVLLWLYPFIEIIHYMLGGTSEDKDKDKEIELPYLNISGQKTSYDCVIYVMKWLEIFEPANIKRWKYEWDNWTQHEVDHFRVEYASRFLFHDIKTKLKPLGEIDSKDIDID